MARKIKVNYITRGERKKVSPEEAKEILEQTLNDSEGGFVSNAKTKKIIYRIDSGTEEINVLEVFIGAVECVYSVISVGGPEIFAAFHFRSSAIVL